VANTTGAIINIASNLNLGITNSGTANTDPAFNIEKSTSPIKDATMYPTDIPIITDKLLTKPFVNVEINKAVERATNAIIQFSEAILTAVGASVMPIIIIIVPTICGGNNFEIFSTPTILTIIAKTK